MKKPDSFRPTPEFYNSQPRSGDLRGICAIALSTLFHLLYFPPVDEATDDNTKSTDYAWMEIYEYTFLEKYQITPQLHADRSRQEIFSRQDPVEIAEYLAGQVLFYLGQRIVSACDVLRADNVDWAAIADDVPDFQPIISRPPATSDTTLHMRQQDKLIDLAALLALDINDLRMQ
jgi:hypothetical protein